MKKSILFIFTLFISFSLFAQVTFHTFDTLPGIGLTYEEESGNSINLLNAGDYYIASYVNVSENLVNACAVGIKTGFNTEITLVDGDEDTFKTLKPKLEKLFKYTDYGLREKLPAGMKSIIQDLSGNVIETGLVDFFVPITHLVSVKDKNEKTTLRLTYFGVIEPDGVDYFLQNCAIPEPVMVSMNKIDLKPAKKTQFGNFKIKIPANYELTEDYYSCKDTTSRDSAIQYEQAHFQPDNRPDIFGFITMDLLISSLNRLPFADSVTVTHKGDLTIFSYMFADYTYFEANTMTVIFYQRDDGDMDVLRITGYTPFMEKNADMVKAIIDSVEYSPEK